MLYISRRPTNGARGQRNAPEAGAPGCSRALLHQPPHQRTRRAGLLRLFMVQLARPPPGPCGCPRFGGTRYTRPPAARTPPPGPLAGPTLRPAAHQGPSRPGARAACEPWGCKTRGRGRRSPRPPAGRAAAASVCAWTHWRGQHRRCSRTRHVGTHSRPMGTPIPACLPASRGAVRSNQMIPPPPYLWLPCRGAPRTGKHCRLASNPLGARAARSGRACAAAPKCPSAPRGCDGP